MKKILLAVDFSEASRNATDYAAALAKSFDGNIVLLHAFYGLTPVGDFPGYLPLSMAEVQEENEALLQREIEYLAEKYAVKADGYVRMGAASGVIKDLAEEIDADLVVMGMKGAGKTRGIFGSTVTAGISKIKKPLLVIPEHAQFSFIKHISFAADFENRTEAVRFGILEEIASHFKADVHVIHVQKKETVMSGGEAAGKIATHIIFSQVINSFHTIVDENIEKGISNFMAEHPTDLLVMIAHHHNLFERLFGTVHTKLVAYQTQVPLLVIHD